MIVCSCNRISDRDVRQTLATAGPHVSTPARLYKALGCGPKCGRCADSLRGLITECGASCCGQTATVCSQDRDAA